MAMPIPELSSVEIITERLRMVPVSRKYIPPMFVGLTPDVTKFMSFETPQNISDVAEYVQRARSEIGQGVSVPVVVLSRNAPELLVGGAGLHNVNTDTPEIGIWIRSDRHGVGYGSEVVRALVDWGSAYLDVKYFVYPVAVANTPSRRVAEKLGGEIAEERVITKPSGVELDEVVYHIPPRVFENSKVLTG